MTTRTDQAHAEACCFDCGPICHCAPAGCEYCGSHAVRSGACPKCTARFLAAGLCACLEEPAVCTIDGVPTGERCLDVARPVTSTRHIPLSATA